MLILILYSLFFKMHADACLACNIKCSLRYDISRVLHNVILASCQNKMLNADIIKCN